MDQSVPQPLASLALLVSVVAAYLGRMLSPRPAVPLRSFAGNAGLLAVCFKLLIRKKLLTVFSCSIQ